MKISDSNPIQFWLAGKTVFNDLEIYGINKQFFVQAFKISDHVRIDAKFDLSAAPTYSPTTTYNAGDRVYSTVDGLRFVSLIDGNINHNPAYGVTLYWALDIPRPAFSLIVSYNVGDEVVANNPDGNRYVYKSITDGNLNNVPNTHPTEWQLIDPEDPSIFKLAAYVGDIFNQVFDFVPVRNDTPNQVAEFDFTMFPVLVEKFLSLKIQRATLKAFIAPVAELGEWIVAAGSWTSRTSETFRRITTAGFIDQNVTYELLRVKAGNKIKLTFRLEIVSLPGGGTVSITFQPMDNTATPVGNAINASKFAVGVYDISGTTLLTADSTRLYLTAYWDTVGIAEFKVSLIASVNDIDDVVLAYSDCIDVKSDFSSSVLIEYTNLADYDNIAYRDTHPVNRLRIQPAHFWEHQDPREEEDYADSKGDVITLKTKIEKQVKLSVAYFTAYMHTKLAHIFNHDFIRIDGVVYKGRAAYTPIPIERSTLYAGSVWLTEQGSVLVNIGGQVTGESGGIFDDSFDDTFE